MIAALALGAGLVGTYEEVAERMLAYHALGIELFLIHFSPMLEELERFGGEVVPRLRAALGPDLGAPPEVLAAEPAAVPEAIAGPRQGGA